MTEHKKSKTQGNNRQRARPPQNRSARELAMDILTRVDTEQAYSNLLLNQTLQKANLPRNDAGLVTELVYGTIQRLNTIDYYLSRFVKQGGNKLEPWVRNLLRLSFYQVYYLDRIPSHAAVNEAVTIAGRRGHKGISGMVNAVLRNVLRQKSELTIPTDLPIETEIALQCSHPEWLVQRWIKQYGEDLTRVICESNNRPPHTSIRVNVIKVKPDEFLNQLVGQGIAATQSTLVKAGITVANSGNMALTSGYEQGFYSIQDESSMMVAELVDPKPGMLVLDCCAAPGGKTMHMAEKMNNTGLIHAFDIHEHKINLIEAQAQRLGITCISTSVGNALHLSERFENETFDRILVDAPCSGFGVIRRKPDLKWSKTEKDIHQIREIQLGILSDVHRLLKPGGVLVYSTCTIEYEENQSVVEQFVKDNPNFMVAEPGYVQILPHEFESDGFFITKLQKT
jgi:16S rRNA (cytosine967-C5)-methyltransferase